MCSDGYHCYLPSTGTCENNRTMDASGTVFASVPVAATRTSRSSHCLTRRLAAVVSIVRARGVNAVKVDPPVALVVFASDARSNAASELDLLRIENVT